jgi:hypothetical protein
MFNWEGQDGREGHRILLARVEDGTGIYLVADEVYPVLLTEVEDVYEGLFRVTLA